MSSNASTETRIFALGTAGTATAAQDGAIVLKVLHLTFDQLILNTDKIDEDPDSEKIPLKLLQCIEILYDNVTLTSDDQLMVSGCRCVVVFNRNICVSVSVVVVLQLVVQFMQKGDSRRLRHVLRTQTVVQSIRPDADRCAVHRNRPENRKRIGANRRGMYLWVFADVDSNG